MKLALDDEVQALLVLSSLPDSWETLVVSLSNSSHNGAITMGMVNDNMFNEEARKKKEQGISFHSEALVAKRQETSKRRKSRKYDSREKSRGKSNSKIDIKFFHYSKPRHIIR